MESELQNNGEVSTKEQKINYKDRLGQKNINRLGSKMEITEYVNSNDITVKFKDGYVAKSTYAQFEEGGIKNPNDRTVFGVGVIGIGKFKSYNSDYTQTLEYRTWCNMLYRVFSPKSFKKHPTYIGCTVCTEWQNFQKFGAWYEKNYYEIEGENMEMDKDILVKNNKIYSPETCVFVPQKINVVYSACKNENKEELFKKYAEEYKDKIPQKIYDALMNYEVKIDE